MKQNQKAVNGHLILGFKLGISKLYSLGQIQPVPVAKNHFYIFRWLGKHKNMWNHKWSANPKIFA